MKWVKITIETTTEATDMLSYALSEYGVEGIEIVDKVPLSEEDKKAMFIDILPELPPDDGTAFISCYIEDSGKVKALCEYIEEQLEEMSAYMNIGTGKISVGETEDKDWINNWKEFFKPLRIEDNIVIQPTWKKEEDTEPSDIVILLDPGTAFGTGGHETTRLCISNLKKYMEKYDNPQVLDAGCGSGILSIVAAKLGASKVFGFDIDQLAVDASIENLELNNIPKELYKIDKGDIIGDRSFVKEVISKGKYDVVVANILADVIVPLSETVPSLLKPDGIFISSGIIDTKENEVRSALEKNGFVIQSIDHMGEWVSITAGIGKKTKQEVIA